MHMRPRGRGGFGGPPHQMMDSNNNMSPSGNNGNRTDTLHITVSNVKYAVTEEIIRKVFEAVVPVRRIHMINQQQMDGSVQCVVQFPSANDAERGLNERNGRFIYADCNKMTMMYTHWESFVPQSILGSAPMAMVPPQQQGISMFQPQPLVQQAAPQYVEGPYAPQQQQQQAPPQPSVQQYFPQAAMMQPQMMPQPGRGGMGGMMPHHMMMPMGAMGGGFNPMGDMGGRGGRGGMRGGISIAMNPMSAMNAMNPMNPMNAMSAMNPMGMMMGMMPPQMTASPNQPTVYLSLAHVSQEATLYDLFTLLEAFGSVATIRRNHKSPTIVTVKMASIPDAEAVIAYLKHVPLGGQTISAKRFPTYQERNMCTDDGDPKNVETAQFDFTSWRHRIAGQRSKSQPTRVLKVTMCSANEGDMMAYFSSVGFAPEHIYREGDATMVKMDTVENAVRLLVECQFKVCGEERANVIFVEDPNPPPVADDAQNNNSNNMTQMGMSE